MNPQDYTAFFLWPHVTPPDWLMQAHMVYALAGEVRQRASTGFIPLRATPKVSGPRLWYVVRAERLDWDEDIYSAILRGLNVWEKAGNALEGLQIDFDAATRGLDQYAAFLSDLRKRLPTRWQLSITGLMDWSSGGDPTALTALADCVDEIVVQTYQGRHTIPGYESYFQHLRRLNMAYHIGVVENGAWQAPKGLSQDPHFKGYVVFLIDN